MTGEHGHQFARVRIHSTNGLKLTEVIIVSRYKLKANLDYLSDLLGDHGQDVGIRIGGHI